MANMFEEIVAESLPQERDTIQASFTADREPYERLKKACQKTGADKTVLLNKAVLRFAESLEEVIANTPEPPPKDPDPFEPAGTEPE